MPLECEPSAEFGQNGLVNYERVLGWGHSEITLRSCKSLVSIGFCLNSCPNSFAKLVVM
jgi:hypothetical protein